MMILYFAPVAFLPKVNAQKPTHSLIMSCYRHEQCIAKHAELGLVSDCFCVHQTISQEQQCNKMYAGRF